MKLTPKIEKAIIKATMLHNCQIRKGDDLPYIIHPFSVACILSNYTEDENVIAAGLLHDILEEVECCNYAAISRDFGKKTADIVREVTEDKELKNRMGNRESWKRRKNHYIENLRTCSQSALMVSAADKIHNLQSMKAAHEAQGEKLWQRFNASKEDSLWFYTEVLRVIKSRTESKIISELEKTYQKTKDIFI